MSNRTIIIVWWWSSGDLTEPYDTWQVTDSSDVLVRVDTPYSPGAIGVLGGVLGTQTLDTEVIIFLHRSHGYNDLAMEEIGQLPEAKGVKSLRCFLFGEGSDQIYLTNNSRGLLGTKGTFLATYSSGEQIDARAQVDAHLIKKSHFDHVWNHYANSFQQRIFEFSEDLYVGLTPLVATSPIEKGLPYDLLRRSGNELLLLRLLSFVGKIRRGSRPENDLRKYEIADKRTYIFPNLSRDLTNIYPENVQQIYHDICVHIKTTILSDRKTLNLTLLSKQFSHFLKLL